MEIPSMGQFSEHGPRAKMVPSLKFMEGKTVPATSHGMNSHAQHKATGGLFAQVYDTMTSFFFPSNFKFSFINVPFNLNKKKKKWLRR